MSNPNKIKSFALLLFYDLEKTFRRMVELYKDLVPNTVYHILIESYYEHFTEHGWPDIYDYFDDSGHIVGPAKKYIELISNIKVVEEEGIFQLLKGLFEIEVDQKSEVTRLIAEVINRTNGNILVLGDIMENYYEFKKRNKDLEIGTLKFDEVLLGKINKGRKPLTSDRSKRDMRTYFDSRISVESPVHQFILENLPFEILEEVDNITKKRINQYYKRKLGAEIFRIIDPLNLLKRKNHQIIGFCFVLLKLSDSYDQFQGKMNSRASPIQSDISDYMEYLRNEGRNILKGL